jgi:hypothetical protein
LPQILHFLPEAFFFLLEQRDSFLLLGFLALPWIRESSASEGSGSSLGNTLMVYRASIFVLPLLKGSRAGPIFRRSIAVYLHMSQTECKLFFADKSPGPFFWRPGEKNIRGKDVLYSRTIEESAKFLPKTTFRLYLQKYSNLRTLILANKPGASHRLQVRQPHKSTFAFSACGRKFKPPAPRGAVDPVAFSGIRNKKFRFTTRPEL